ncbi:MAG TPA: riboflavin biosynthesis protein RibF [Capillibacterium sp.]
MKQWYSFSMWQEELAAKPASGWVVTVGNFDGVHRGHQKILERVKVISKEQGWPALVITFQEHTSLVLRAQAPPLLMSVEERCRYFAACGIDATLLLEFTPELAKMPAGSFLDQLRALGMKALVVGHDFTFGAGGTGDTHLVLTYMRRHGLYGEVIPPVKYRGKIVCSSQIRSLLQEGRLAEANGMLNRPFALAGYVQNGQGQGRKLGFPTANLTVPPERLLPKFGAYVVRVQVRGGEYYGLANVGCKPTFNYGRPLVEVFIDRFSGDIYGEYLQVEFLKFLREEKKFASPAALQAQLQEDRKRGEAIWRRWQAKGRPARVSRAETLSL